MPIVADELGNRELYGWVYTAFFLGNLLGVVLAGGALDRMPLHRPFAAGLVLFGAGLLIGGLAPSMPILVLARFIQGLGGGAVAPTAYVAIGRVLPENLQPRMFAMLSTAWVVPGIIGPSIAAVVGEAARLALGVPRPAPVPPRRGRPRRHGPPARQRPDARGRARGRARDDPPPPERAARDGRGRAARRRPDRRDAAADHRRRADRRRPAAARLPPADAARDAVARGSGSRPRSCSAAR